MKSGRHHFFTVGCNYNTYGMNIRYRPEKKKNGGVVIPKTSAPNVFRVKEKNEIRFLCAASSSAMMRGRRGENPNLEASMTSMTTARC